MHGRSSAIVVLLAFPRVALSLLVAFLVRLVLALALLIVVPARFVLLIGILLALLMLALLILALLSVVAHGKYLGLSEPNWFGCIDPALDLVSGEWREACGVFTGGQHQPGKGVESRNKLPE